MPNYLETAVNEHWCVLNLVVYVRNATTFYLTLVEGKFDKNKVKRKNDQDFHLACRIKQASRRWYKHQGLSTHCQHTGSNDSSDCLFFPRSIFRPYKVYFQHQIGEGEDILLILALESSLLQPLLKTNKKHKSTRIIPFLATRFMY